MSKLGMCGDLVAFGHELSSGLLALRFWQLKEWMMSKPRMRGYVVALVYERDFSS